MRRYLLFLIIFLSANILGAYPNQMLWNAASAGDLAGVMKALSRKADINSRSDVDEWGSSALHMAVKNGHANIVRYLVSKKKIKLNVLDDLERTPLHIAARLGNFKIIVLLFKAGADPYLFDCEGQTPFSIAQDEGDDITAFLFS